MPDHTPTWRLLLLAAGCALGTFALALALYWLLRWVILL